MDNEKIISRRKDSFFVTYAQYNDFPQIIKIVDNLSEESKKFYHPWMFKKKGNLKIRIGQLFARVSLVPKIGKLIKSFFPFGYSIILKCVSKENQIVGIISIYNFKRLSNGTYFAIHADMIIDEFQGMGLGSFQRAAMNEVAKKENVGEIWMRIHVVNEKSLSWFLKNGYHIIKQVKNIDEYNGEKYDMVELLKKFNLDIFNNTPN